MKVLPYDRREAVQKLLNVIRDNIPFDLIGELVSKINVDEWIKLYEEQVKR